MLSSILSDANARSITFGSQGSSFGFVVPNVWTATKTGTSTTSNASVAKDSWMVDYSPVIATAVWNGNHDGAGLRDSSNTLVRRVIADYVEPVHTQLYANEGKWTPNQAIPQPAGIQRLTVNGQTDIWPSWYNSKTSGVTTETLTFNKYTNKLASDCTPADQKISIDVTKTTDPITGRAVYSVPEPYNKDETDDCSYKGPTVSVYSTTKDGKKVLTAVVTKGSADLANYSLIVDGKTEESGAISGTSLKFKYEPTGKEKTIKVVVSDSRGYEASDTL